VSSIAFVTPADVPCGVSEYGWYFVTAVEQADPALSHRIVSDLHPRAVLDRPALPDLLVLNYHAALLSQWTPGHLAEARDRGAKVLAIYHDTGTPNTDQCQDIVAVADLTIMHEPSDDLPAEKVIYLRQGVPDWESPCVVAQNQWKAYPDQPVVGTVGFPAPWKNLDLLCEASALAGWAVVLLAPEATAEQVFRWHTLNPASYVVRDFTDRRTVLRHLTACDATAFVSAGAFNGTSGAIRQGIAARKPVIASHPDVQRQHRDLYYDKIASRSIRWLRTLDVEHVARALEDVPIVRVDPAVVRLAARDAWAVQGQKIAALYRQLLDLPT
jgi:hypothetical protein